MISVLIPAYNEAENIATLVNAIKKAFQAINEEYEIIIADGRSTDQTVSIAEQNGARCFIRSDTRFGCYIKEGVERARGDYVLTMDADFSHNPEFIKSLVEHKDNAQLIIASRYIEGGVAEMGWVRKVLSIILNQVYTLVLHLPYHDISSGFRLYQKEVFEGMEVQARDFDVLEEILLKIHARGAKIMEIPFHYYMRREGKSHVKLLKFAVSYFQTLFRMWQFKNHPPSKTD